MQEAVSKLRQREERRSRYREEAKGKALAESSRQYGKKARNVDD